MKFALIAKTVIRDERGTMKTSYARISQGLAILMLAIGAQSEASAGPIAYTINFTTTSGLAPTSGSFDYDSSQSVGSQFSSFFVTWDGISFNLTSDANGNISTGGDCTTPTITFLMTGIGCLNHFTGFPEWYVEASNPTTAQFNFEDHDAAGVQTIMISADQTFSGSPPLSPGPFGTWTATATSTSVPEPSTLTLAALGGGAFLLFLRWTSRPSRRQGPRR